MQNILFSKGLVLIIISLFIGIVALPSIGGIETEKITPMPFSGNTLYVGGSGPGNYSKIQDAINDAIGGDTVFVYNGTYYENVIIDKSIDMVGEEATTTIIDGRHIDDPLWINTSFVNVCGFTVMHSPKDGWSQGICIVDKKWHGPDDPYITLMDITISGCIVEGNNCGIRLSNTKVVEIAGCTIRNNSGLSVYNIYSSQVRIHHCTVEKNGNRFPGGITICKDPDLGDSEDVEVFNCMITGNVFAGIIIDGGSSQVNVHHNEICGNPGRGIFVSSSSSPTHNISIHNNYLCANGGEGSSAGGICLQDCIGSVSIEKNQISSNTKGVYLLRSSDNTITGNNIIGSGYGVNLDGSSCNLIDMNTIIANNEGVALVYSNDNTISRNNISSKGLAGISFHSSSNNTISGNTLFNGSYGMFFEYCSNDNQAIDNVISNNECGLYLHDSHGNHIDSNLISNNDGGIKVCYSADNVFSGNIVVDNIEGICFYECIDNGIYHNVFCNNSRRNAFFCMSWFLFSSNRWDGNYWDRPRLLPYPIFGRMGVNLFIPWVNFDWHPEGR